MRISKYNTHLKTYTLSREVAKLVDLAVRERERLLLLSLLLVQPVHHRVGVVEVAGREDDLRFDVLVEPRRGDPPDEREVGGKVVRDDGAQPAAACEDEDDKHAYRLSDGGFEYINDDTCTAENGDGKCTAGAHCRCKNSFMGDRCEATWIEGEAWGAGSAIFYVLAALNVVAYLAVASKAALLLKSFIADNAKSMFP